MSNQAVNHHPVPTVLLCLSLLLTQQLSSQTTSPSVLSSDVTSLRPPASVPGLKLDPDQRILHLLSRFTFGATPLDITAIRQFNADRDPTNIIDRWFEEQLHPGSLPDQKLNSRLAEFPAMELPVDLLLEQFPSGAEIRQAANHKRPIPDDPYLAPIYLHQIALYDQKKTQKQEKKAVSQTKPDEANTATVADQTGMPPPKPPDATSESSLAPANTLESHPALATPSASTNAARPTYADLLVKSVLALPSGQRVKRILQMQPAEYEQFHSNLKSPQKAQLTQGLDPYQRELLADYENPTRTVVEELQSQRLLRDILSTHQLQEVMTTFWLNHFNVYLHKNDETPYYLVSYERDVIRPLALGNFEDLLIATAESPAMLLYLDNSSSTGPNSHAAEKQKQHAAFDKIAKPSEAALPGLNENYARELMELHTLGVNGGYTQADVTEVAKIFTGWTVARPQQGGDFLFDESRHEPGKKLVMGHKIKEKGQKEGLQFLHILATSPATAHFISLELAIAFVSDTPPPALVDRMAQNFLKTHGNIPSILRTMLHSPEFWAPEAYRAKVKTPLEYVVSAARASGAEITNTQPLINALNQMGMPLYACVPPTGYSVKADAWVSTGALVTRMNFGLSLGTNHFPGIHATWTSSLSAAVTEDSTTSPADAERILEARLIPTGISDQTRTAVLAEAQGQTQKPSPVPLSSSPVPGTQSAQKAATSQAEQIERQNAQLAGLLIGSPEFQRR